MVSYYPRKRKVSNSDDQYEITNLYYANGKKEVVRNPKKAVRQPITSYTYYPRPQIRRA